MSQSIDADKLYADVWQLRREGNLSEGLTLTSAALAALLQGGDSKSLARVLCVMGQIEHDQGREEEAVACYREAAGLYRAISDQVGLAYALRHECDLLRELGRLAEAAPRGAEALAIYRALNGAPLDLANMLRVCALLKEDLGDIADARRLWAEAGGLYRAARINEGVEEARAHLDQLR
jgi:tetratricopeptide (TPR) repeat protein